jgi:hypothetical protein
MSKRDPRYDLTRTERESLQFIYTWTNILATRSVPPVAEHLVVREIEHEIARLRSSQNPAARSQAESLSAPKPKVRSKAKSA